MCVQENISHLHSWYCAFFGFLLFILYALIHVCVIGTNTVTTQAALSAVQNKNHEGMIMCHQVRRSRGEIMGLMQLFKTQYHKKKLLLMICLMMLINDMEIITTRNR